MPSGSQAQTLYECYEQAHEAQLAGPTVVVAPAAPPQHKHLVRRAAAKMWHGVKRVGHGVRVVNDKLKPARDVADTVLTGFGLWYYGSRLGSSK